MFGTGNQDHRGNSGADDAAQVIAPQDNQPQSAPAIDPALIASEPAASLPAVGGDQSAATDEKEALDDLAAQLSSSHADATAAATTAPVVEDAAPAKAAPAGPSRTDVSSDELLQLKQHALQQLTPLVGHLEQTPEDRFKTYMMMIQASDDRSLINNAYQAAQDITDEKVKAQALLDIVNEINYFTQQANQ